MWPTPQDYNEAVQNPAQCFADAELAKSRAEVNQLGLPKPRSGSFASVYHMHAHGSEWAVRCFLQNFQDQGLRYNRLSQFLSQRAMDHTVDFQFVPKGIFVQGSWFPILKMQWVQGEDITVWIERHLDKPGQLAALRDRLQEMCLTLMANGMAHGDLQHGNILVVNGQLKLVDYDGMFVPELVDLGSHEIGHRHYQHPMRHKGHFGPYLDNFSAWSIYTSLDCLASDPELWYRLGAGDECLLFRFEDYQDPQSSVAFRLLEHHEKPEVRTAARRLRALLPLALEDIPALGQPVPEPADLPAVAPLPALPSWMLPDGDGLTVAVAEGQAPDYLRRAAAAAAGQQPLPANQAENGIAGGAYSGAASSAQATGGASGQEALPAPIALPEPVVPPSIAGLPLLPASGNSAVMATSGSPLIMPESAAVGDSSRKPNKQLLNMRMLVSPPVPEAKPVLVVAPPPLQGQPAPAAAAAGSKRPAKSMPAMIRQAVQPSTPQAAFEPLPAPSAGRPCRRIFRLPAKIAVPAILFAVPVLIYSCVLGIAVIMHTGGSHAPELSPPSFAIKDEGDRLMFSGQRQFKAGDYTGAESLYLQALVQYDRIRAFKSAANCNLALALCYRRLNQADQALGALQQARDGFIAAGDKASTAYVDGQTGDVLKQTDRLPQAANWYSQQLNDASESFPGNRQQQLKASQELREVALELMRRGAEGGLEYYQQAIDNLDLATRASEYCLELQSTAIDLQRKGNYAFAYQVLYLTFEIANEYDDDKHTLALEALQALQKNLESQGKFSEAKQFAAQESQLEQENLGHSTGRRHLRHAPPAVVPNPRKRGPVSSLPDEPADA